MRIGKKVIGIAGGLALVGGVVALVPVDQAQAARRRVGRQRGLLQLVDVNVGDFGGVHQNHVIEFKFTSQISAASLNPATFQIRAEGDNGGFTKQVAGDFQLFGSKVRFFPRLPTHLRNPDNLPQFYAAGTPRDDADANAGLQPNTDFEIKVIGSPSVSAVRNKKGRRLLRTYSTRFATGTESPKNLAFSANNYGEFPPPGFQYSNPPDKVASVVDQYAIAGGTREVPNAIVVSLFGNQVPLSPDTVRQGSNVSLTLLERLGDPSVRKPIAGTPFLEQNYDTVLLIFEPRFPLPDVGVYSLRVTKDVKDLTETFTFKNNPERLRLREIYDFLAAARDAYRQAHPGQQPEAFQLADPPIDQIFDWPQGPQNAAARAVLKANVLTLGDSNVDEVDPRAMVIFSTRNEPVSEGSIVLEFLKDDGFFDESISTAQWDDGVAGAVAAISTIAGGTAVDGDFSPAAAQTISVDAFPNYTINWRRVIIPPGVIVNLVGSRPAIIKALELTIEGELRADGAAGENGSTGGYTNGEPKQVKGGLGGPGGGKGGDSHEKFSGDLGTANNPSYELGGTNQGVGHTGEVGVNSAGRLALVDEAGGGGLGGKTGTGTYYRYGGGGGGGGSRLSGSAGSNTTSPYTSWDGTGGLGGPGSNNPALSPLFGAAGGGAGGNSTFPRSNGWNWNKAAGAGGGGGGGMLVQTATVFTVGSKGVIRSRGGRGGAGTGSTSALSAGPGGGAGGGALLLRSTKGFNFANPGANTDVAGGNGGSPVGTYSATGGAGGAGYVRLESPGSAAPLLPGATVGEYSPIGGGEPSSAYTTWIGFGVVGPRILNFTKNDFDMSATSNDAVFIEVQYAVEDPAVFGKPLVTAVLANQNTSNPDEVTPWYPIRVWDRTGKPGGAFGAIAGQTSVDQVFAVADMVNGKNFQFFRCRYTFQLDATQSVSDIFPNVARQAVRFQFNF